MYMYVYIPGLQCEYIYVCIYSGVSRSNQQVVFAKEPYERDDIKETYN